MQPLLNQVTNRQIRRGLAGRRSINRRDDGEHIEWLPRGKTGAVNRGCRNKHETGLRSVGFEGLEQDKRSIEIHGLGLSIFRFCTNNREHGGQM